jgi:NAD-dependent DNA ligase
VICDRRLDDEEIKFINEWLTNNEEICQSWPGDILHKKIREVLADGVITADERAHLVDELQKLIGGDRTTLSAATHVTELAFDDFAAVQFSGMIFCLTGDFVYGPRNRCCSQIEKQGGSVIDNVTKKLHYLVIGSLGSPEWKHGSFGTKVEKAMKYKRDGLGISIVKESRIFS